MNSIKTLARSSGTVILECNYEIYADYSSAFDTYVLISTTKTRWDALVQALITAKVWFFYDTDPDWTANPVAQRGLFIPTDQDILFLNAGGILNMTGKESFIQTFSQ